MSIIDTGILSFLIEQSRKGMAFRNTICRNRYGHLKAVSFGGRFGIYSFNTCFSIAGGVWIDSPTPEKVTSFVDLVERQMELDLERLRDLHYYFNTYGVYKKALDSHDSFIKIARPLSLIAGFGLDKSPLRLLMVKRDVSHFEDESVVRRYSFSSIRESAVAFESSEVLSLESLSSLPLDVRDLVVKGTVPLYSRGERKFLDHYDHWDYDAMSYPETKLTGIGDPV